MIVYYIMRGDVAAQKKRLVIMNTIRPWFYVEDERGNQLVEPDFHETPIFGEAEKIARKMSRERGIKTRVNVLICQHFFVNGRIKKEF